METAIETVQMLTMVVLVGFTSPVDGAFAPTGYSFYRASAAECAAEQERNQDARRRVICLEPGRGDGRSVVELLRDVG
jgi:hypothetical protein